jgi:hypothetical protein
VPCPQAGESLPFPVRGATSGRVTMPDCMGTAGMRE